MSTNRDQRALRRAAKHKARRKDAGKKYGEKVRETRDKNFKSMTDIRKTIEDMVTKQPDLVAEIATETQQEAAGQ